MSDRPDAVELGLRGVSALAIALIAVQLVSSGGLVVSQDLAAQVVPLNVVLHPELYPDLVANFPTSQLVFNGLVLALGAAVGLRWAVVAVLLIGCLGWVASWAALARRFGGHPWATAAVAAGGWLGWLHVMGFHNYLFGNLFVAGAAAVWVHRADRVGSAWAAVLLAIAAVAHPFAALHGIGLLVLGAAATLGQGLTGPRLARLGAWVVPAALFSVWALLGAFRSQGTVAGLDVLATGWQWGEPLGRLADLAGTTFVAYSGVGWALGLAAIVAALASPLLAAPAMRRSVAAVVVGGLVVALAAPTSGLGWAWVGQRLAALPLLVGVASVSPASNARAARAVAALLAVVALARAGADLGAHRAAAADLGQSIAAMGEQPVGRAYAVWVQEPQQIAAPHAMVDVGVAGWSLLNGGMLPGMFATTPSIHWALFRAPVAELLPGANQLFSVFAPCAPPSDCAAMWTSAARQVALNARFFDSVVIVHPPQALAAQLASVGFRPTAAGALTVATSGLRVSLPVGFDSPDPIAQIALADGTPIAQSGFAPGGAGQLEATLTHLLAGPVVLRIGSGNRLLLEQTLTLEPGAVRELNLAANP